MTDAVLISITTSTSAVIMAAVSAYFAYRAKVTATETHQVVNSRMTAFMEMAKKAFHAEGVEQEKKDAAVRAADAIISRADSVIITPQVVVTPSTQVVEKPEEKKDQ